MSARFSVNQKKALALALVALVVAVDFAVSMGGSGGHDAASSLEPSMHGHFSDLEPADLYRSKTFPRLGSVGLNLTHCLHGTGDNVETCAHDLYGASVHSHGNGDHWGNAYRQFVDYFADQLAADEYAAARGGERRYPAGMTPEQVVELELAAHGLSEDSLRKICLGKRKPLEDATDLPDGSIPGQPNLTRFPLPAQMILSSVCRFAPFIPAQDVPWAWKWWQYDYHEQHTHDEDGAARPYGAGALFAGAAGEAGDAFSVPSGSHASHSGPHGLDFNTETNWLYVALSHQQKVAIVNLNVVDWGKVATYEEQSGYRVLLVDDDVMLDPWVVQHYASQLLQVNRHEEAEFARAIDAVHRYCFAQTYATLGERASNDNLTAPAALTARDPDLAHAVKYFSKMTRLPEIADPVQKQGWACFLTFTGLDVRLWHDPLFTNPFCTYDTRHLARYDALWSPGLHSRANPTKRGAGDAWRCDWFVRYVEVTNDVTLRLRRAVHVSGYEGPLASDAGHVLSETQLDAAKEYVEVDVNVSIGPHDVVYNPVNGLLYVTHYWQFNDPDVRMLPDWTIHAIDGNPGSPAFHNPYDTRGGPAEQSLNAAPKGTDVMNGEPFIIDVGGPMDGLHPVTVDVDVRNGRVFVVNRESNTISMLVHDGRRDFTSDRAQAILSGPKRLAVELAPDSFRFTPRDMSLYHDPESLDLPTPEQLQGRNELRLPSEKSDCHLLSGMQRFPHAQYSKAQELCEKGLLQVQGLNEADVRALLRPDVEEAVRRLIETSTSWPTLVAELRDVLAAPAAEYPAEAERFLLRWEPHLLAQADRDFLRERLDGLVALRPSERARATAETLARAEDRLVGRTEDFVNDTVETFALASGATGAMPDGPALVRGIIARWSPAASSGELLGMGDASLSDTEVQAFFREVEPIVASTFLTGTPAWVSYCLTYSIDVVLQDGFMPMGKESDNGIHPFHCDDVYPPHYPDATPIQVDYVGASNRHHVFIIREPVGPLVLDWWYEIRPRLFQPFDLWINAGDGNVYVSNLGNHDNVPLVRGWISIIQSFARVPCILLSCVSKTLLPPPSGWSANLLIDMDVMPHHLNVNPYTFEVYGGHLMGNHVRNAQFEPERATWTIPETHTVGSDLVPGASPVPNPHPTGMAVNPATQRLFMTHFLTSKPYYNALTDRMEDMSRYVSIMDLHNYTLLPDMIYGGDHHAIADAIRPPGFSFYEQPFYNRSALLNVGGRAVSGAPVVTADSTQPIDVFYRCTYFSVKLAEPVGFTTDEAGVSVRPPAKQSGFTFDSGRCFNLFDMEPQVVEADVMTHSDGTTRVFESPEEDRLFWEYGEEHLTFGVLNLFLDPDNVPPTLRVLGPHGRDRDRFVDAGLQASEELAAAWIEADTPEPAHVPKGALGLQPVSGASLPGSEPWALEFDSSWIVESRGPPRAENPDQMRVRVSFNATDGGRRSVEVANWSAQTVCCAGFRETRIPLAGTFEDAADGRFRLDFEFDSVDPYENARRGWSIVEVRLESGEGEHLNRTYDDLPGGLEGYAQAGMVNVTPVLHGGEVRDALSFRRLDDGSYAEKDRATYGLWGFEESRTFQRARLDTGNSSFTLSSLAGLETYPVGNATPLYAFVDGEAYAVRVEEDADGAPQYNLTRPTATQVPLEGTDNVTSPVLVLVQRQDVEVPDRLGRRGQPYDEMIVEASVDGGVSWKPVWRRDSRDAPQPDVDVERVDVTSLVHAVNGVWQVASAHVAPEDVAPGNLTFRLRFEALDPILNDLPGWSVAAPRLVRGDGHVVPLAAAPDVPARADVGLIPVWHVDGGALRFANARGTYAGPGGQGGADGLACRLGHGSFGTWGGSCERGPGSSHVRFMGRDLEGHVTELTHQDGRGVALVEDTFENPFFTERYWTRETDDPAGVGFPAYVLDASPDGQGDLYPEDTPVELLGARLSFRAPAGDGAYVPASRVGLFEGTPDESNFFFTERPRVTEAAAMVSDGPEFRRAFLVAGSDPDVETLPEELRRIVLQEGMWLNASHVMQMRAPEPVKKTLTEISEFLTQEGCMETLCLNLDAQAILKEFVRTLKMAVQLRQVGMREAIPIDRYVMDGTPDLPQVASETLRHEFPFRREGADVESVDFAFDFVARHRFEDYVVPSKPGLPRLDLGLLDYLVNNVTLAQLNMTNEQLQKVFALSNATKPLGNVTDDLLDDAAFLTSRTLADVGYTAEGLVNLLIELVDDLLAVEVPASEILNDMDRLQLSLPTWGSAFSVNVTLERPDGSVRVLGARDGVTLDHEIDLPRIDPAGDVRITLSPNADRTADVRLGFDVGRFERIRVHYDDDQADDLMPASGGYALALRTTVRTPEAPSPGMLTEVVYGDLGLYATVSGPNQAPDPDFAWTGPVRPGAPTAMVPQRAWAPLANLEDQDGHVRAYNWTFPAALAGGVSFANVPGLQRGVPILPDADASYADDLRANVLATSHGRFARALTLTTWGEGGSMASLRYEASGQFVPTPALRFPAAGAYDVTLTVVDDEGASASRTHRVVAGGVARPPEILSEPIRFGEDGALAAWQNNTGSLLLQARGRSIDLTPFLDLTNVTLDAVKRNVTLLRERVDYTNVTEFTRAQIDGAVTNGTELVNKTIHDPLWPLDVLVENLLLRPGSVQVVSKQGEDATTGVRAQVLMGEMPEQSSLLLPLLANLTNLDLGFLDAPETLRMAREGRLLSPGDLNLDPVETCHALADPSKAGGFCDADLENATDLLLKGLLDPWVFRFALHPEVDGAADLDRAIVQVVVMDTGVGFAYFTLIDTIDRIRNWTKTPGNVVDRVLQENLTAMVDPIVPVTPYVSAVRGLQAQAIALSRTDLVLGAFKSTLLAEDLPLYDANELLETLGVAAGRLDAQADDLDDLRDAIETARQGALDYAQAVRGHVESAVAQGQAEADLWALHAYTDVALGPAAERRAEISARATLNLDRAEDLIHLAADEALAATWNVSDALNTTREWAENWTEAIRLNDTSALQAKISATVNATTEAVANVTRLVEDVYRIVRHPVDDLLEPEPVEARVPDGVAHKPLVLGYDQSRGTAFVRVGDEILTEGRVAGDGWSRVRASLSFSSLANHTAEVQAYWGGRGSELRDGFNRDASGPRADNWTWSVGNHTRTWAAAPTRVLEETPLRSHEYLFVTRSPEGLRARLEADDGSELARTLLGLADVDLTSALPERVLGVGLNGVRGVNVAELIGPSVPPARSNGPRTIEKVVATHVAERLVADLPDAARSAWRNDDATAYASDVPLLGGFLQEIRVASGAPTAKSAPALAAMTGKPLAPTVLDVRSWARLDRSEALQVTLQPSGWDGDVSHFDVFATPRPWPAFGNASGEHYLGTVPHDRAPVEIGPLVGEDGWRPGVDFALLNATFSGEGLPGGWRYVTAQAVTHDGRRSDFATPWRIPPVLLEERFATYAARRLDNHSQVSVDAETGWINLTLDQILTANVDSCLGDRVEVTRDWNWPHDSIAGRHARALRVQERGLDSLFMLMRALNRSVDEIPLNLSAYDLPRAEVDLELCPSVRELVETIGNANATTLLGMINYTNKADGVAIPKETTITTGDQRLMVGVSPLLKKLVGNQTIDLDVSELLKGTPAAITWRTPEPTGAYHARVKFLVPGPQLGALNEDTPIDRLLSLGNVGLFSAIIPGERFHLLELGHVDDEGGFTEVVRVDYDPHLLAPLDPEGLVGFLDGILTLKEDPLGALVSGKLPLSYGIRAGDTNTSAERIGQARMDYWHTIDVYAPSPTADVYAVAFDGKFVGQFRTSSRLPPNALRIGGSHVPTEILVDDVRFADALHPPAPIAEVVKTAEAQGLAMVRWHVPEDGGAPLVDANLIRRDLDTGAMEIVATAGSGWTRALVDPDAFEQPAGTRYAYSVQPVNDLDDGAGLPSDLRAIVRPAFVRASADAGIRHNHQVDALDDDVLEGALTASVGGLGEATHRAVFQVNASQVIDVRGRALDPRQIGGATFLAYALATGEARDGPVFVLPTLEEVLGILGYNRDLVSGANRVVSIGSYEEGENLLDTLSPGYGGYVRDAYGEEAYAAYVDGLVGSTRVVPIYCLNELIGGNDEMGFTVLGSACTDAFPEPISFTGLCNDVSRDLEVQELPFNCWEDAIGAYVSGSTDYDTAGTSWSNQPRTDYYSQQTGVDRQATRMLAWRRYDLLPALRDDADGDFTVTLKKEQEQAPSAFARYATVEAGAWLDERVGPHAVGPLAPRDLFANGKGPAGFPWSDDVSSSGRHSVHLGGRAGVSSVKIPANGLATVPLDVPITFDVFIPEGKAPRQIGLKVGASLVDRSFEQAAEHSCSNLFGPFAGTSLVSWGDQLVRMQDGKLVLDLGGELDHAADLLAPRDGFEGVTMGGVPPQRGRWVTLTFDPAQLILEWGAKTRGDPKVLGLVLDLLYSLRGPETNLFVPDHLAMHASIYERLRPPTFVQRVDSVDKDVRDFVDAPPPYDYFIPEWKFFRFNYDKFVEPYLCGLSVGSLELFVVDGEAYVDRLGPDVAPRLRIDAGGAN